jgi:hypothetical protein
LNGSTILKGAIWLLAASALAAAEDVPMPHYVKADLAALRILVERDPLRDAEYSFKAGDLRFRAIDGFSSYVPGIDRSEGELCSRPDEPLFHIRGTSDMVWGGEHAALIVRATEYARRFNGRMLKLRKLTRESLCQRASKPR